MFDHVLCLLPFPEPEAIIDRLKQAYPDALVTYQRSYLGADWTKNSTVPDSIWANVTILVTLTIFPSNLSLTPNLKLVHLFCSGTDHIWKQPIYTTSSVPITSCTGVAAPMIAEWVLMTLLVAEHKYNTLRQWQQEYAWNETAGGKNLFFGSTPACGKRIGIPGYGAVGRQVGNISRSLGMDVFAFTAHPRSTTESKRYRCYVHPNTGDTDGIIPKAWFSGNTKDDLHKFLKQDLDYLLVSLPLSSSSRGLLGEEEFRILGKRNAFIINVARAEVIDQQALIDALTAFENEKSTTSPNGRRNGLSGAALDIAEPEPLPPDHPRWNAPNCIITPHIASIFGQYAEHAFLILEKNLRNMAEGKELLNVVNRDTGYSSSASKA